MGSTEKITKIVQLMRTAKNYVMSDDIVQEGMWHTETWKNGNLTLLVTDEGYTVNLLTLRMEVHMTYPGPPVFMRGCEQDLDVILDRLCENFDVV